MRYKLLSILISCFLLTGCFGGTPTESTSTTTIDDISFSTPVFSSWEKIADSDLPVTIIDRSYYVYQSPLARDGIYSKYIIVYESLPKPTTSIDYAKNNILNAPKAATDYVKINETELEIGKQKTLIHIYTARNSTLAPELLFIQTHVVFNNTEAYTLTFTVAPSSKNNKSLIDTYISLLKGFNYKAKK